MTAMKQNGDSKGSKHALLIWAAAFGLWLVSSSVLAGNVLQDVRYATAPGGKVDITLQFASPVGTVQAFTTDSPPRIAIDLPNTSNGLSSRRVAIGNGATSAVSAAESGGRTRVVVDLFRPAGYTTRSSGNLLVLTVDAGAATAVNADPSKRIGSGLSVANIDFRRGDNGAGRVILRFSGDGATADMRDEGNQVVVDVNNAQIPENLRRRLDVTDFATPVISVEPRANAGGSRLVINTNGAHDSLAYQTGKEYVIEIAPKRGSVIAGADRAAGAVSSTGGSQRYAGKPVTFNFQDVPVRTVLQLIAEESNLNVVASDTVQGNVTLRLVNVPWDQALEIVLRARGLDKRTDGNVMWVAPQEELSKYEQARDAARLAAVVSAPLETAFIPVNYGNAEDIAKLLTDNAKTSSGGGAGGANGGQHGFLSARGSVSFDTRTNTLLIIDVPSTVLEIKKLLAVLDRPVDQVMIEARIVIADETFARDIGARFGIQTANSGDGYTSALSGTIDANTATISSINAANVTNANAILAATDPTKVPYVAPTITNGYITNLAAVTSSPATSLAWSILRGSRLLNLELSALQTEGRGEVISNPRVITSNQREAIITQGDEIGYTTSTSAGGAALPTVAFKEAVLELKVTPTITQDGRVYLVIGVKKDEVKTFIQGIPTLTKRDVSTAVLVDDGNTVVIGGVYEFKSREDVDKTPWLGDVPFLGNFFKKNSKTHSKAELLIFITPRVLAVSKR